jgi:hypothetical protein
VNIDFHKSTNHIMGWNLRAETTAQITSASNRENLLRCLPWSKSDE